MADVVGTLDCVRVTTTTGGTGTLTVGSALAGWLTPAQAGGVAGQRYTWRVETQTGALWELFEGVLIGSSPATISRNRIIRNSSGNTTAVNFDAGTTKIITCVGASDRTVDLDTDGLIPTAFLPPPLVSLLLSSSAIAVPNNTATTMTWDTVAKNTLGFGGSGGFTIGTPGFYRMTLNISMTSTNNTGYRGASLLVGGIERAAPLLPGTLARADFSCSFAADLLVSTVIQTSVFQDSGIAQQAGGNARSNFLLERLG